MRRQLQQRRGLGTALFGAVILLGLGRFTAGTLLEDSDNFCIACHTKPEVIYIARSRQQLKVDLSVT